MSTLTDNRIKIADDLFAFITAGGELILSSGAGDTPELAHLNYKELVRIAPNAAQELFAFLNQRLR